MHLLKPAHPPLAARSSHRASHWSLHHADSDQHGSFVFRGKPYPLKVLNLPCVAETYKTYDDVNLVKSGDVGQVLVVGDAVPLEGPPGESRDGITRPMRNARERIFRQALDVEPEIVSKVEMDLLTILAVSGEGEGWVCRCRSQEAAFEGPDT